MNYSIIKIKEISVNYLKIVLYAFISILFSVITLSFFGLETDTILISSFLFSVVAIEWFYFKRKNTLSPLPRSIQYDLFLKHTDELMYGAIVAKSENDDLISSLEVSERASEIYEWSTH